jgi:hypothetical protein
LTPDTDGPHEREGGSHQRNGDRPRKIHLLPKSFLIREVEEANDHIARMTRQVREIREMLEGKREYGSY